MCQKSHYSGESGKERDLPCRERVKWSSRGRNLKETYVSTDKKVYTLFCHGQFVSQLGYNCPWLVSQAIIVHKLCVFILLFIEAMKPPHYAAQFMPPFFWASHFPPFNHHHTHQTDAMSSSTSREFSYFCDVVQSSSPLSHVIMMSYRVQKPSATRHRSSAWPTVKR